MSKGITHNDGDTPDDNQRSTDLLRKIKTGELNPKSLLPESRQMVVKVLVDEGWSTANIASTLQVSDRTIERDRKTIDAAYALKPDPAFTSQMAGKLVHEAEIAIQRINAVARTDKTPEAVKVDAHHRCFLIECLLFEKLQSAGFIKTATQKIDAEITHALDLEQLENEFLRLRKIRESTPSSETIAQFEQSPGAEAHNGD